MRGVQEGGPGQRVDVQQASGGQAEAVQQVLPR